MVRPGWNIPSPALPFKKGEGERPASPPSRHPEQAFRPSPKDDIKQATPPSCHGEQGHRARRRTMTHRRPPGCRKGEKHTTLRCYKASSLLGTASSCAAGIRLWQTESFPASLLTSQHLTLPLPSSGSGTRQTGRSCRADRAMPRGETERRRPFCCGCGSPRWCCR